MVKDGELSSYHQEHDKDAPFHSCSTYSAIRRNEVLLTCYDVGEAQNHYAKGKMPDTEGRILYDSVYVRYLE